MGYIAKLRDILDITLEKDPAARSKLEIVLAYPGFHAMVFYYPAHRLCRWKLSLLARWVSSVGRVLTGIEIHPSAIVGERLFIDHGMGVVVGGTAEIGNDVTLYQGVTLGALSVKRSLSGHKRHPTIEDDVIIYAGATVLGGDTRIGQGSVIGGNLWIVNSIPPKSIVIGTPPSFKMQESAK